ncbi:MAG: periplasmic heavy metal sensor, partial [Prosthecobacter sp.]|nr:periplasmic heavy metal sensor [Prosthecobacter sp.]
MKLLLPILLTAAALAYAGPETWLQGGLISPDVIQSLKDDLALSSEQEEKMRAIISSAQSEGEDLEKNVREQQRYLNGLLRDPATTPDAAASALTRLLEAEAPVKQLQLRTLLRLRDVLSPEQQRLAAKLAPGRSAHASDLAAAVRQKAEKLRAEVESLGIKPTRALSQRGAEIESLIKAGDWPAAERALTQLSLDCQADAPAETE